MFARYAAALVAAVVLSTPLHAQGYPERTVDTVLPYPAGGGIDLMVRVMSESLAAQYKQSFVVSNRTGAGGAIGIAYVARSAPDGYTLLFAPALAYSVLPLMQDNVGYTDKSFTPICQAFENQMALIVRPDSPYKTARDIVEAARSKPPAYAATSAGTITHLAAAALAEVAKVNFNHVPFRGDAELMGQVIGGHVDFATTTLGSATAAGGSIRVVAIFADKRNPSLPDTPTVKEQGYDVAPTSFGGLFAPAGTPADVVNKLGTGCKVAVEQPGYIAIAKRLHQGTSYYADAAAFTKRIEADVVEKRDLLKRLGLTK
jgi:tripartite-type tricarboxylate transporter receptor subunit TctC